MTNKEEIAILIKISTLELPIVINHLEQVLKSLADLIQNFKNEIDPVLEFSEAYIETLLIKILLASNTSLQITKGQNLKVLDNSVSIIDFASLYVIARSILECFLTLEYLFLNGISQDEKTFRLNLWKIAGFMTRQNSFKILDEKFSAQINSEREEIDKLKSQIKTSKYYESLTKNDLWKLDKFGLPRIISWSKLLENSVLTNRLFDNSYRLYSNYAHSEFLSIMQLNEINLNSEDSVTIENSTLAMNNIRMINCVAINLFVNKFEKAKDLYGRLDSETKYIIDYWNKFATS